MDDVEPVLRTPVSDMAAAMFTQQMGRPNKCGDFELRYKLCVEAYGKGLGKSKCQDYFDDLDECINMRKQVHGVPPAPRWSGVSVVPFTQIPKRIHAGLATISAVLSKTFQESWFSNVRGRASSIP